MCEAVFVNLTIWPTLSEEGAPSCAISIPKQTTISPTHDFNTRLVVIQKRTDKLLTTFSKNPIRTAVLREWRGVWKNVCGSSFLQITEVEGICGKWAWLDLSHHLSLFILISNTSFLKTTLLKDEDKSMKMNENKRSWFRMTMNILNSSDKINVLSAWLVLKWPRTKVESFLSNCRANFQSIVALKNRPS